MRSTQRLIELLRTVNAEAVDNDAGQPGEFLAELCRESAERLQGYAALIERLQGGSHGREDRDSGAHF